MTCDCGHGHKAHLMETGRCAVNETAVPGKRCPCVAFRLQPLASTSKPPLKFMELKFNDFTMLRGAIYNAFDGDGNRAWVDAQEHIGCTCHEHPTIICDSFVFVHKGLRNSTIALNKTEGLTS